MEEDSPPPTPRPVPGLERQLSLESEPKTLFSDVMDAARSAALEVIREYSEEEALKIFLKTQEKIDVEFDDLNATKKKLIKYDADEDFKVDDRR